MKRTLAFAAALSLAHIAMGQPQCGVDHVIYSKDFNGGGCPPGLTPLPAGSPLDLRDRGEIDGQAGNICLALDAPRPTSAATGYFATIAPQWQPHTLYEVEFDVAVGPNEGGGVASNAQVGLSNWPTAQLQALTNVDAQVFMIWPLLVDLNDPPGRFRRQFFDSDTTGSTWRFMTGATPPTGPVSLVVRNDNFGVDTFIDNIVVRATPIAQSALPTGRDFRARFGEPVWAQTEGTSLGSNSNPHALFANGSEIDALYARVDGDTLHLGFAGNLSTAAKDAINIFLDFGFEAGAIGREGQSWLASNNPQVLWDQDVLRRLGKQVNGDGSFGPDGQGVVFDAGFTPVLYVTFQTQWDGESFEMAISELRRVSDSGGVYGWAPSSDGVGWLSYWPFHEPARRHWELSGNIFATFALDNSNVGGVGGIGAPFESDPALVETGVEVRLDGLRGAGWDGVSPIRVAAFLTDRDRNVVSNQVVGGSGSPGAALGEPREVNFRKIPGKQYALLNGAPDFFDEIDEPSMLLLGTVPGGGPLDLLDVGEAPYGFSTLVDIEDASAFVLGEDGSFANLAGSAAGDALSMRSLVVMGQMEIGRLVSQVVVPQQLTLTEGCRIEEGGTLIVRGPIYSTADFPSWADWPVVFDELPNGGAPPPPLVAGGDLVIDGTLEARNYVRTTANNVTGTGTIQLVGSEPSRFICGFQGEESFLGNVTGSTNWPEQGFSYNSRVMLFRSLGTAASTLVVSGSNGERPFPAVPTLDAGLRLMNNAILRMSSMVIEGDVYIESGSSIRPHPGQELELTIAGDLHIEEGGTIYANGRGAPAGQGPGRGEVTGFHFCHYGAWGGSGHGGKGGRGNANNVQWGAGGPAYDNPADPRQVGTGASCSDAGARGGGLVRLIVGGEAVIDGDITANAGGLTFQQCGSFSPGGASGGGILLAAQSVRGGGLLTARGSVGGRGFNAAGGGGGGGMIAVYAPDLQISVEQINVLGGSGVPEAPQTACSGAISVSDGGETGTIRLFDRLYSPCAPDVNRDGSLSAADFTAFREAYLAGDMTADFSGDGALNTADFAAFRDAYLAGCP